MKRFARIRRTVAVAGCFMVLVWLAAGSRATRVSGATPVPPVDYHTGNAAVDVAALETHADVDDTLQAGQSPDATLEIPWNGILWESTPNFTWAACGIDGETRKAVDIAVGQWAYAAANQGLAIRLTEVPCVDGATTAQIPISVASGLELPPDAPALFAQEVFGMTLSKDVRGLPCSVATSFAASRPCHAQISHVYLFTANWNGADLSVEQAAKTVAHEIGHAVGLAHARFCNFDSLMAQNCEPILRGLGPADVQSLNALVDFDRQFFGTPPIHAKAIELSASGRGMSITYRAGWNLVAGPRGTNLSLAAGSLYTILPGDASYRPLPAATGAFGSVGYWAYFPQDVTIQLNGSGTPFYTASAEPGSMILIGNSSGTSPMYVNGVSALLTFDPATGEYQSTDTLQPGQAAWAKVGSRGQIRVTATSLTNDQVACYVDLGSPSSCSGS